MHSIVKRIGENVTWLLQLPEVQLEENGVMSITDTTGIIKLIVGNEACGNKYDASVPCNGPLQPGKQYR